ncbi:MAG: Asp23/Gls24 family envelope stress response protein [Bacillota bacterium]|nr:Asp23/Gls24 family envelope stress response protein [Bacillota bacterium]
MSLTEQQHEEITKIPDEAIAVCALNAALKTEGVAGLAGGISNTLSKNFLGKELLAKGIKVSQSDEGVEIDVHITVKYHTKIPAVAWDIQENVKKEVQSITEIPVTAVNIHVQGVELPEEKAAAPDGQPAEKETKDDAPVENKTEEETTDDEK